MATFKGDLRYMARCFKCKSPMGDWALKLPKEQRLCWDCRPHDLKETLRSYKAV